MRRKLIYETKGILYIFNDSLMGLCDGLEIFLKDFKIKLVLFECALVDFKILK